MRSKKRVFTYALVLSTIGTLFTACGNMSGSGDGVKTGFAVVSSAAKSTAFAAGEPGLAEADSVVAAVTVDEKGKLVHCFIDAVQTKINFDEMGMIQTPLSTTVKSKQELGDEYGMKKASGIGKEWNEQANAFAKYVTGKTLDEIKGIAVNDKGAPTATDLSSSVTISVGDFIKVLEKAVTGAKDLGAKKGDKLGIGTMTNIAKSLDATAEQEGLAQAYSTYAAVTFGSEDKITSCIIDGSQTNVNFNQKGELVGDIAAEQKSKNELGAAYGMKKASTIGKEWNEQADAFAKYAMGKTPAEVKGIAVNEKGSPTAADLTSSVTLSIGDFSSAIEVANSRKK